MSQYYFKYNYINTNDGKKYTICKENYKKVRRNYIVDEMGNSYDLPLAKIIRYDRKSNLLFVYDDVPVFKDYTCHISYFVDLQGNVVGPGVCDYDGRLIDVILNDYEVDPYLAYEGFKIRLKVSIAKELYKNNGDLLVGQKRLLKTAQKRG